MHVQLAGQEIFNDFQSRISTIFPFDSPGSREPTAAETLLCRIVRRRGDEPYNVTQKPYRVSVFRRDRKIQLETEFVGYSLFGREHPVRRMSEVNQRSVSSAPCKMSSNEYYEECCYETTWSWSASVRHTTLFSPNDGSASFSCFSEELSRTAWTRGFFFTRLVDATTTRSRTTTDADWFGKKMSSAPRKFGNRAMVPSSKLGAT